MHAYERSTPVNNYTVDACGAVHITIGDAGNSEGLSFLNSFTERKLSARPPRQQPLSLSVRHMSYVCWSALNSNASSSR